MQIEPSAFTVIPFDRLEGFRLPGETAAGANYVQQDGGGIRMRIADYEAGYIADHWCDVGHFGYVLSGTVIVDLKDMQSVQLRAGQAFLVSSYGDAPHRVRAETPVRMLLLD